MVNATEWINQNYPENGVCRNKDDIENYGKRREEITDLDVSNKNLEGALGKTDSRGWTSLRKINASFNKLLDGELGSDNWLVIEEIILSHNQIGTGGYLWGDHLFLQLKKLNLSNNFIELTDLSKAPRLTHLDISGNFLTELDLHNNINLKELRCLNNPLLNNITLPAGLNINSLDYSQCPVLPLPEPSATSSSVSSETLSTSDKIAISLGIPGFIVAVFGAWVAYKQLKASKKRKKARTTQAGTELNELRERTSQTIAEEAINNQAVQQSQQLQARIEVPVK